MILSVNTLFILIGVFCIICAVCLGVLLHIFTSKKQNTTQLNFSGVNSELIPAETKTTCSAEQNTSFLKQTSQNQINITSEPMANAMLEQNLIAEKEAPKTFNISEQTVCQTSTILQNQTDIINLLNHRLEENEKLLKEISKKYFPLLQIKNKLEKSEQKLEKKQINIAKQKIIFYGINNNLPEDASKLDKLSADILQMEKLKDIVKDCQNILNNNQDKLPLYEYIYNLLIMYNQYIKQDIDYFLKNNSSN